MDASELRYDDLVDRIEVLYNDHRYRAATDLLNAERDGLEVWAAELAHLKACLLGADGDADGALRVLQDASTAGAWWRRSILTEDDDLAALQDRPAFLELIELSESRVVDDPVPPLMALPGQAVDGGLRGVVVALHGAGQTAGHARRDWGGVVELGYALVCVQSSYRMSPRYRTWPDPEQARADIARALAELPAAIADVAGTDAAGRLPVVAAGFSAGGRVALDWALTGRPTAVAGVLALAPALRELPAYAGGKLSPATIWIGTDDDLLEVVDGAAEQLTGFGCSIERLPGLGHAFPAAFDELLAGVL
ncbi:alpha/beta hydrolase [Kribbella sp. C-35]|uniref:alpha/beta hydrolase n=1 Tax=Kribbella sp. C-35 TaxID=2789276 RepID=UPI00397A5F0F